LQGKTWEKGLRKTLNDAHLGGKGGIGKMKEESSKGGYQEGVKIF